MQPLEGNEKLQLVDIYLECKSTFRAHCDLDTCSLSERISSRWLRRADLVP